MDNRGGLLKELEQFRLSEVAILTKAGKHPGSIQSTSQKNFFQTSHSNRFTQTQKSSASGIRSSLAKKHPLLDIKLGPEFRKLKEFKVHFEGELCSITIENDCLLELQKITLPFIETFSATVSILVPTLESVEDVVSDLPVYTTYGLKHFDLQFSRDAHRVRVAAGARLDEAYYLTLRLYC